MQRVQEMHRVGKYARTRVRWNCGGCCIMLFLVSFLLLFVGCVLCCAGEMWAVVLYLPFVVGMLANDIDQSRQRTKRREECI